MVLDSKFIPIHVTSAGENVIVCTKFEEAFFNVLNISVSNNYSIIAECIKTVDSCPIVKIDVAIAGKIYKNVEFKIIIGESIEAFVNEKSLKSSKPVIWKESPKPKIEQQAQKLEQVVKRTPRSPIVASPPPINVGVLRESAQINQESYILECLNAIQADLNDRFSEIIRISKEAIIRETFHAQEKLKSQNSQNLTHDVENIIKDLNNQISKIRADMSESIKTEYKDAFESLKQGQKNLADKSKTELANIITDQTRLVAAASLEEVSKKSNEALDNQWDKIEKILSNHSTEESKILAERIETFQSDIITKQLEIFDDRSKSFLDAQDQWVEEAVQHKIDSAGADINKEIKKAVDSLSTHINELHEQKIAAIKDSVNDILEVDESLVTEARTSNKTVIRQLFDSYKVDINKELQGQISIIQRDLNRKAAQYASEYGGGGGSVAMQFAEGGTMGGTLDIRGQILSGGVDLVDIFSGGSGGTSQTLVFNESNGLLTITPFGNTVSLSALSGHNGGTIVSGNYLPLTGGNLTGSLTINGTLSSSQLIYDTAGNSSQWNSVFTTVQASSAAWILDSTTDTGVRALTATWQNTSTAFASQSANNASVFTTVNANSASWSASPYLSALNDVFIPAPVNGQVLTYNSITNKWNAGTPLSAAGATGYYGSFYDTTAQTLTSTTQAKRIDIAQTYEHNGVSIYNNRIVFNYNGVYELIYSIQYKNTDTAQQDIYVWLKQNGNDIPNSSSIFTIPARKNDSIPSQLIAVSPFMSTLTTGDFIELYWHCNSTAVTIETFTTHVNPTIPDTPGVIVTAKQVTNVQIVPTVGEYLPLSGGTLTGAVSTNQDIEITDLTKGIILRSPGSVKYRVTVSDAGELITTLI